MSNAKITGGDSTMHECEVELRRGPWTLEEDNLLIQYISCHGEGRWNSLAKFAGLKRTGKSCRLRWLNYLKPDIKRGDLSPHEQLLILELHSKWGNRWSKIAQHLPGRTDNEIKNYWRTRVQKQARQLKVDSNSNKFLDAIRRTFWMPRLLEQIDQDSPSSVTTSTSSPPPSSSSSSTVETHSCLAASSSSSSSSSCHVPPLDPNPVIHSNSEGDYNFLKQVPISTDGKNQMEIPVEESYCSAGLLPTCFDNIPLPECHVPDVNWFGDDLDDDFWNSCDELWQFRK